MTAHLKEDKPWAPAGYEVAFGQYVEGEFHHLTTQACEFKIVEGRDNVGFYGEGFGAMFGPKGLVSLTFDGQECIQKVPMPIFSHAYTDNERGYQHDFETSIWYAASLFAKVVKVTRSLDHTNHLGVIRYDYVLPTTPSTKCSVSYSIAPPGLIGVDVAFKGKKHLPDLPAFGLSFSINKAMDRFEFFGRGPKENYLDRCSGARLGRFAGSAAENLTPYLKPQECGLRTDVRWMDILDSENKGIRISMVKEPLNISVLPYNMEVLQAAGHAYELPPVVSTVVNVYGDHMGVGGDDSWGAPVLDEYTLDSAQERQFSFILSRVEKILPQSAASAEPDEDKA